MRLTQPQKIKILLIKVMLFSYLPIALADEWAVHESRFSVNRGKILNLRKEIEEAFEKKKHAHSSEEIQHLMAEASKKHVELEKAEAEQEAEIRHVMYKHPERGEEVKRKYSRAGVESLEQMEKASGPSAQLDRMRKTLVQKYKMRDRTSVAAKEGSAETPNADGGREPASTHTELDILKPIKFKK